MTYIDINMHELMNGLNGDDGNYTKTRMVLGGFCNR